MTNNHFFPEEHGKSESSPEANVALYPDISRKEDSKKLAFGIKRAMDIFGSAAALLFAAPILAAIAIALATLSMVMFAVTLAGPGPSTVPQPIPVRTVTP